MFGVAPKDYVADTAAVSRLPAEVIYWTSSVNKGPGLKILEFPFRYAAKCQNLISLA